MIVILRTQAFRAGLALCLAFAGPWCQADILEGRVVGVSDGDTITLLDAHHQTHKIRLSGIDAPEKGQAFGQNSKQHLSDAVFGKDIQVDHNKKDRYGRLLGKLIKDGEDLNLKQIQAGLAWHYKAYAKEQSTREQVIYSEAELEARRQARGLWRDANPMPPWEWRHGGKQRESHVGQ